METRLLRYFLSVVEERNISSAANALHITQPTLSRQLKEFEDSLGVELFIRKSRTIKLTRDGRYLAEQARDILELVDKTRYNIGTDKEIRGEITIGMGESRSVFTVLQVFQELMCSYPNITLNIMSGNAEQITEQLDNGLLDYGVLISPTDTVKYESLPLPQSDNWGILTHIESEFANNEVITSDMLFEKPIIISRQKGVRNMIANLLNIKDNQLNIVATYNLVFNASLMAEAKIGHVVCIDGIVNTENTNLKFIPFNPPITSNLNMVWKKQKEFSEAAEVFLQKYREEIE